MTANDRLSVVIRLPRHPLSLVPTVGSGEVTGDTINKDDLLHVVGGRGVRTRYQIYGHEFLDRSQIGISVPKICPECLLVYGYKRKFWDIDFVSVCPEHRTRLVKECVKCQAPISWYSLEPSICRCGYIFENGRHVCTDEEISWALWLKQMFEPDLNFDGSQVLTNLRSHRLHPMLYLKVLVIEY